MSFTDPLYDTLQGHKMFLTDSLNNTRQEGCPLLTHNIILYKDIKCPSLAHCVHYVLQARPEQWPTMIFMFHKVREIPAKRSTYLARWRRSLNGPYVSQVQTYRHILQCVTHMCCILQKLERYLQRPIFLAWPELQWYNYVLQYMTHMCYILQKLEMTFSGPYFLQVQSYSDIIMSSSIWSICVTFCKN